MSLRNLTSYLRRPLRIESGHQSNGLAAYSAVSYSLQFASEQSSKSPGGVVNCDEQVRTTFLDLYTTERQNLDADTTAVLCGVIGAYAHLHLAYPSAETNERKPNSPLNVHG
jgi:hypothetical protein